MLKAVTFRGPDPASERYADRRVQLMRGYAAEVLERRDDRLHFGMCRDDDAVDSQLPPCGPGGPCAHFDRRRPSPLRGGCGCSFWGRPPRGRILLPASTTRAWDWSHCCSTARSWGSRGRVQGTAVVTFACSPFPMRSWSSRSRCHPRSSRCGARAVGDGGCAVAASNAGTTCVRRRSVAPSAACNRWRLPDHRRYRWASRLYCLPARAE
jgi:hypothetical protein